MLKLHNFSPLFSLLISLAFVACSDGATPQRQRAPGKIGTSADNTAESNTGKDNSGGSGNTDTNPNTDTSSIPLPGQDPTDPGSSSPQPSGDPNDNSGGTSSPSGGENTPPSGSTYGDKIVAIARAELGRSISDVGKDLQGEPGRLQPLLISSTEPWCSELVSWAYKIAGVPLSGGSKNGQPDWMLTSTVRLRSYFQEKNLNPHNSPW